MKIMESQIRLGTGDINDPTTKNLMDELKKTVLGRDVWEGVETKVDENSIMDPSRPIEEKDLDPMAAFEKTVENMVSSSDSTSEEINNPVIQPEPIIDILESDPIVNISEPYSEPIKPMDFNNPSKQEPETTIKPAPASSNLEDLLAGFSSTPDQPINNVSQPTPQINTVSQEPEEDINSLYLPEDDIDELEPSEEDSTENEIKSIVDLDIVLSISNPKPGGIPEPKKEEPIIIKESEPEKTQKVEHNSSEMLFNSLLSQFK
jgi:hypothetical protein